MTVHRFHPDPTRNDDNVRAVLFDDCDRCAEHAEQLTSLDDDNLRALWELAILWNTTGPARALTQNEACACRQLWRFSLLIERSFGLAPVAQVMLLNDPRSVTS